MISPSPQKRTSAISGATRRRSGQSNRLTPYYDGIANALDDIAKGNIVGMPVDIRHGVQKYLLMSHAIYFRTSTNAIEVLRVLHQSMDVRRHL